MLQNRGDAISISLHSKDPAQIKLYYSIRHVVKAMQADVQSDRRTNRETREEAKVNSHSKNCSELKGANMSVK